MAITNSNVSYSGLVEKYIGTAYDTVKIVADNIEHVITVGNIEGIEDIAQDIEDATTAIQDFAERAELAADEAEASAISAAADAATAASDAAAAQAAAIQTANDVVTTNDNVLITNADVVITNANVVQTNEDAAQTAADRVQTGLDRQQTQLDVITTGQNAQNSQDSADASEAALYTFQGQYLGAHATAPTVDINGDPLTAGDLYQDTFVTPNLMKFWNGSTWLEAFSTSTDTAHNTLTGLGSDDHQQYILHDGTRAFTGTIESIQGLVSDPAFQFTGDTNTGIFSTGAGSIDFAITGGKKVTINSTGLDVVGDITVTGTVDGVDVSTLPSSIALKEDILGNPSQDGDVLISTTLGVRSWDKRVTTTEVNNGLALKEDKLGSPVNSGQILSSLNSGDGGIRSWVDNINTFLKLPDTPINYTNANGKALKVNQTADGIIFEDIVSSIHVGDTPPGSPSNGAGWFNSDNGQYYTWYISPGNGASQWVKDNESTVY